MILAAQELIDGLGAQQFCNVYMEFKEFFRYSPYLSRISLHLYTWQLKKKKSNMGIIIGQSLQKDCFSIGIALRLSQSDLIIRDAKY